MATRSQEIAEALSGAIGAQELPPGFKLGERQLAEACNTSRAVVKQALLLLGREGLVQMHPNRGSFVAELDAREAFDIFEAIAAIEQGAAFQLIARGAPSDLERLECNVCETQCCLDHGDDAGSDRIGPEFHVELVRLARNRVLEESHARLLRRSQLIRLLYTNRDYHRQRLTDDHALILSHMKEGRVEPALRLIANHYDAIARGYDMDMRAAIRPDLEEVLSRWLKPQPLSRPLQKTEPA